MKKDQIKDIAQTIYGLVGMIVFFAVLFYGGNTIIRVVGLYFKYVFFIGLPIVAAYWLFLKVKNRRKNEK